MKGLGTLAIIAVGLYALTTTRRQEDGTAAATGVMTPSTTGSTGSLDLGSLPNSITIGSAELQAGLPTIANPVTIEENRQQAFVEQTRNLNLVALGEEIRQLNIEAGNLERAAMGGVAAPTHMIPGILAQRGGDAWNMWQRAQEMRTRAQEIHDLIQGR